MGFLTTRCPKCGEHLEIDSLTGEVVRHQPETKGKDSRSMTERLKALGEEKARREAVVSQSREREQGKKEQFDKLFGKVKEEAREGPPAERPLRDFDLD
jgi:hypothetical protein